MTCAMYSMTSVGEILKSHVKSAASSKEISRTKAMSGDAEMPSWLLRSFQRWVKTLCLGDIRVRIGEVLDELTIVG